MLNTWKQELSFSFSYQGPCVVINCASATISLWHILHFFHICRAKPAWVTHTHTHTYMWRPLGRLCSVLRQVNAHGEHMEVHPGVCRACGHLVSGKVSRLLEGINVMFLRWVSSATLEQTHVVVQRAHGGPCYVPTSPLGLLSFLQRNLHSWWWNRWLQYVCP